MSTYSLRTSSSLPMIDPGPAAISSDFPPVPSLTYFRWRSGAGGVVGAGCSSLAPTAAQRVTAQSKPIANLDAACLPLRRSLRRGGKGPLPVMSMTRTGSRDRDAGVPDDRLKVAGRLARVTICDQATLDRTEPPGGLQSGDRRGDPAHADLFPKDNTVEPFGINGHQSLNRLVVLLLGNRRGHVMGHVAADDQQDRLRLAGP